jgi:hypothetical protein
MAGTADVPGAFGSSILNLILGGTTRPTVTGGLTGATGGAGAGGGAGSSATAG